MLNKICKFRKVRIFPKVGKIDAVKRKQMTTTSTRVVLVEV